jgi:hypothetical protein
MKKNCPVCGGSGKIDVKVIFKPNKKQPGLYKIRPIKKEK